MLANTHGISNQDEKNQSGNNQISAPSISLPKGGGAERPGRLVAPAPAPAPAPVPNPAPPTTTANTTPLPQATAVPGVTCWKG